MVEPYVGTKAEPPLPSALGDSRHSLEQDSHLLGALAAQEFMILFDNDPQPIRQRSAWVGSLRALVCLICVILGVLDAAKQIGDYDIVQLGHTGIGKINDGDLSRCQQEAEKSNPALLPLGSLEPSGLPIWQPSQAFPK
jgi:hypothetical protein